MELVCLWCFLGTAHGAAVSLLQTRDKNHRLHLAAHLLLARAFNDKSPAAERPTGPHSEKQRNTEKSEELGALSKL